MIFIIANARHQVNQNNVIEKGNYSFSTNSTVLSCISVESDTIFHRLKKVSLSTHQFIEYNLKSAKMNVINDLNKTIMNSKLVRMPVDNLKKVYNMMPNLPELEMKRRNYGKLTLIFLGLFLGGCLVSFYLYYVILDFEIRRVG